MIKYILSCISRMNYKELFKTVGLVHKISGQNSAYLFFDIIRCGIIYGAGYKDYLLFEFYNLTAEQRRTYVTRGINNKITKLMNNREYYQFFDDKSRFYRNFSEFIGRQWVYVPDCDKISFKRFMEDKDEIIIKPSNESCGTGVEKIKKSAFGSVEDIYGYISSKDSMIAEEVIHQHPAMDRLFAGSVNTLRIVTIYSGGRVHVIYGYVRIGNGERPVDNINAGGMCAPIDIETGIITHPAYDKNRVTYKAHPVTGCPIENYQIPMWDKAMDICRKAAKKIPQMGYVGWDVAITENGPVMVEGNNLPGHDILQMPPHIPDKIGMLPRFKMYVCGL